jgi:hypothetical protein
MGTSARSRRARRLVLCLLAGLAVLAVPLIWRAATPDGSAAAPALTAGAPALTAAAPGTVRTRRETRPTLDPARFVGKAALAHQVAREIPDTLDQLYCYCECDKHSGHKSLLSCYTDGHAAT